MPSLIPASARFFAWRCLLRDLVVPTHEKSSALPYPRGGTDLPGESGGLPGGDGGESGAGGFLEEVVESQEGFLEEVVESQRGLPGEGDGVRRAS